MANGTIAFDTLQTSDAKRSGTTKSVDTSYIFNGVLKAWIHFTQAASTDLTTQDTITNSFNISSLGDEGTGKSQISFTSGMDSVFYPVTSIDWRDSTSGGNRSIQGTYALATGSYKVSNVYDASVFDDLRGQMNISGDLA
tara:strand:+ start:342 stop:761 length:420 start_codon:yes stop_codon:yes gene_type:complete